MLSYLPLPRQVTAQKFLGPLHSWLVSSFGPESHDFVERHLGSAWVSEGLFLLRVGSSSAGSDLKAHDQSHDLFSK